MTQVMCTRTVRKGYMENTLGILLIMLPDMILAISVLLNVYLTYKSRFDKK